MEERGPGASATARRKGVVARWSVRLLVLAGLAATAEVGSYIAYRAIEGRRFSYARCRRERLAPRPDDRVRPSHWADIHPYLGYSCDPESRANMLPGEDPPTQWGFPDKANRSPVRKRAPGKVVVGILGASVASLFAAQGQEALKRELKQSPHFAGQEIEFVNLAVGSFKQPQQLMALNYALSLGAEFDVVINLDGFNEVAWYQQDNAAHWICRFYPLGWHEMLAEFDDPVSDLRGKVVCLKEQRRAWASLFSKRLLRHSVTANLIWKLRDRHLAEAIASTMVRMPLPRRSGYAHRFTGPREDARDWQGTLRKLAGDWERCSLLIDRLCKAHGIAYYHFLQPNQYVPGSKVFSQQERETAYTEEHPIRPLVVQGYPLLREGGRRLVKQGVFFRDLSLVYAHHEETFYSDNCCHINRAGAEALAGPIARALTETSEPPLAEEESYEGE
jgi:hypothetical protein